MPKSGKLKRMEKTQRDFKGIWIPKEIWLSDKLSLMEKVLFVEIHSLDNERGCFASNRYFADFFNISERQISTYISSLKGKGFVTVSIRDRNDRTIRTAGKYARVSDEKIRRLQQMRSDIADRFSVDKRRRG